MSTATQHRPILTIKGLRPAPAAPAAAAPAPAPAPAPATPAPAPGKLSITLRDLQRDFPLTFPRGDGKPRPLAIGITAEIEKRTGAAAADIAAVLNCYTAATSYHWAVLTRGAQRVDLDGNPVEPVAAFHRHHAFNRLLELGAEMKRLSPGEKP